MTKEQIKILLEIAKIAFEHKESSEIIGREMGLSEEEMDDLYDSITNQVI